MTGATPPRATRPDAGEPLVGIGEVARRTGVPASALRYYDDLGLVPPAARVGGRRRYGTGAVRRVGAIRVLQQAGFTLDEIGRLLDGGGDWRRLAAAKAAELDRRLVELERARRLVGAALACDCERLESCGRLHHLDDPAGTSRRPGDGPA